MGGPVNGAKQFSAVRYNSQGQSAQVLSATFLVSGAQSALRAVAELPEGDLIAAGSLESNPVLARFNPDGSLDTAFGTGGFAVFVVPGAGFSDVLVLADGRIVAGGSAAGPTSNETSFLVARLSASGVSDPSFARGGFTATRLAPGASGFLNDIAVDAAGRIIAAGMYRPDNGGPSQFAATRYSPDGSLDTTFGGDGVVTTNVGTGPDVANAVAILTDGGILLGGAAFDMVGGNRPAWAFVKYQPDGTPDPAFGNRSGEPGLDIIVPSERGGVVNDLVARESGGFHAAGTASLLRTGSSTETTDLAVGAFTASGAPDASFGGGDGNALAGFADGPTATEVLTARLARQSDGKLVVAGTVGTSSTTTDFALARFTATGALDNTFSEDGRVTTDLSTSDLAADMALLSDGRIVVVGATNPPARPVLLRYLGDSTSGVSEAYVRGSAWGSNFKTYMEGQLLGDDVLGYRISDAAGNQAILPWVNLDEIVLRYGSPPTGGGIPSPGTVTLDGVRSDYTVTSVTSLDPQTYVLRLDRPLGNLPGGGENGDRVRLGVAGTGAGGGTYSLTLNILQGDVNRSGSVVADDFSQVRNKFFRSTAAPGPAGPSQYTVFHDVDGNGGILGSDFSLVKARFFDSLPPPAAALRTSSITSELFRG